MHRWSWAGRMLRVYGWSHWRNTVGALMQVLGAGGPSEKRRPIFFLRSRTKPGFT